MSPARADLWVQLGHAHKDEGQPDQAALAYRQVTEETASHADVWPCSPGFYLGQDDHVAFLDTTDKMNALPPNGITAGDYERHADDDDPSRQASSTRRPLGYPDRQVEYSKAEEALLTA